MDKKTEMIARPRWKTLAVQLLIWSSLLPFHKDTRVLPWLQTYLCHLNCLGFHHKDDQIDFNSFLRAEIIKHNFSLICKECPLFEVNSALSSGRNNCLLSTAGEATEVSLSRVCTLQVCPWTDNLLVVRGRQREGERGGRGRGRGRKRGEAKARLKEFICQLELCRAAARQHCSAFSNHCVAKVEGTKTHWSLVIPPVWYGPIPVIKVLSLCLTGFAELTQL